MDRKTIIQTIVISMTFFLLLYLVTYVGELTPEKSGIKFEPIHVFIALVPFIVLLIASGKLKEVKGPGGITLSMRDEAQKIISLEFEDNTLDIDPEIIQAKGGIESLRTTMTENPPTTLSFVVGKKNFYGQWAIEEYIRHLKSNPNFRYILFTDENAHFKGYMNVDDYSKILERENGIVPAIENGTILNEQGVKRESIETNLTNREVLDLMERKNINELAVVDQSGRFIGTITQEQIVRKVLSKIIREI